MGGEASTASDGDGDGDGNSDGDCHDPGAFVQGQGQGQAQRGSGMGGWRGCRLGAPGGCPPMAAVAHRLPWGGNCCGQVGNILSESRLLHPDESQSPSAGEQRRSCRRALYAGLHAYGDLTAGITRTMLSDSGASALVSVACCYNLLTEPEDPERAARDVGRPRPPFDVVTSVRGRGERSAAESVLRAMLPGQVEALEESRGASGGGGNPVSVGEDAGVASTGSSGFDVTKAGHEHGFPLSQAVSASFPFGIGRSARMLACQSADRWAAEGGGVTADSLRCPLPPLGPL